MNRNQLVLRFVLLNLILSLPIVCQQQSGIAQSAKNTAESPIKEIQAPEPSKVSRKPYPVKIGKIKRTCGCTAVVNNLI
jgi:hypothetical protein